MRNFNAKFFNNSAKLYLRNERRLHNNVVLKEIYIAVTYSEHNLLPRYRFMAVTRQSPKRFHYCRKSSTRGVIVTTAKGVRAARCIFMRRPRYVAKCIARVIKGIIKRIISRRMHVVVLAVINAVVYARIVGKSRYGFTMRVYLRGRNN